VKKQICAAIIAAAVAGAPLAAFASGPRASSGNNWPGMMQDTPPVSMPANSPFEGPRPSSLNNWQGMNQVPAPGTMSFADPVRDGPRPSGH
jgi:hypothetical protein